MTIVKDISARLISVVGSTGAQGGSVIRALQASQKPYRVRAITRDITKPRAKELEPLGCELVLADVNTVDGAKVAFEGADLAFAMTLTDYTVDDLKKTEFARGKTLVDSAKASGIKTLVWSGETSLGKISGGKYPVDAFDVKEEVTSYARSISGIKVLDVQPGAFASNFVHRMVPRKQDDGSYTFALPLNPDTSLPVIDEVEDFGKYVVGAIENDEPETVYAGSSYITPSAMAESFAKVSGKTVNFSRVPDEVFRNILKSHGGEKVANSLVAMYQGIREVGYYGGQDLAASNAILSRPARNFEEILRANQQAISKIFA